MQSSTKATAPELLRRSGTSSTATQDDKLPANSMAKPKRTNKRRGIQIEVAEESGLSPEDVKRVFEALKRVVTRSLHKHGAFKLEGVANIRMKPKPSRSELLRQSTHQKVA
jgi:nucleoid DNA-binding protein